jgi:hypothetical protein
MRRIRLTEVVADLLRMFADAYEQPDASGQKDTLMFSTSMGGEGTRVQHHALPEGSMRVSLGDLHELDDLGLIDIRYGRGDHDGSFRVTGDGYDAVEQIERRNTALAESSVVPPEGARMGLDWETEVFPVLQAAYQAYSRAPSSDGVSQAAINSELGRPQNDPHTSLALRKLQEADYVRATMSGLQQVDGPLFCEPGPKALELLAGWPTERGDTALARLIAALETRIEETTDPEEKGKLQRVLDGVQDVTQGVMVGVLTKVITGG